MRTIWLASYPKSGNTWFRMLVANLRQEAPIDINDLPESGGIASARAWFDHTMLFDSGLLTHEECDVLRPLVYAEIKRNQMIEADEEDERTARIGGTRFIKSHDAYTYNADGTPLLGGLEGADAAILVVRDPRDVAPSLANHNRSTLDEAIAFMGRDAGFCTHRDRQPNQLRQQLPTWGGFNASWLDQTDLPLKLVRYEDMQADVVGTFHEALAFAGLDATREEAEQAARFADFGELKRQETERGFREAPVARAGGNFFRRGISGAWRDELTPEQVARIEQDHAAMMARLGYDLSITDTHEERLAS